MKRKLCLIISLLLVIGAFSACATKEGKTAMSVAEQLIESGLYEEAAEQCAIAIGNGVKDEKFVHMADTLNAYNAALKLYQTDKIDGAKVKIAEIVDYSGLKFASEIESLKDKINSYDKVKASLDEIKELFDFGNYQKANELLSEIDEGSLTDGLKNTYVHLKNNVEEKFSVFTIAPSDTDYSQYSNSLTLAYITGAETGNVYFWNDAVSGSYSAILSNGTSVYTTGQKSGGRTLICRDGIYGWVTSRYLSSNYTKSASSTAYIQGASTGSVYVWKNSTGNDYYDTISNGTKVKLTGRRKDNRTEIKWGNGYGWITDDYVR